MEQEYDQNVNFNNIMISTDGSDNARVAFNLALQFYDQTKLFDQIIVTHISDKTKEYLPKHWKPDHIYNEYKTELLSLFPSDKYKMCFEEKRSDQASCRDQILDLARTMKVSFLFIGFTGRKGDKENQTILSQTVKHSAFQCPVPLFICKRPSERQKCQSKGYTFLACVDGSKKSYYAMNMVQRLATHPNDKLVVVYAPSPDKIQYVKTISAEVSEQLKDKKVKWEFKALGSSLFPGKEIADYINKAEDNWINFCIVGQNGYRAMIEKGTFFGRQAENILLEAKTNIIIV